MDAVPKNKLWKTKINVKAYPKHKLFRVRITASLDINKPLGLVVSIEEEKQYGISVLSISKLKEMTESKYQYPCMFGDYTDDLRLYTAFQVQTFDRKFFSGVYEYMNTDQYIKDCLAGTCNIEEMIESTIEDAKVALREHIVDLVESRIRQCFWDNTLSYVPVPELETDNPYNRDYNIKRFRDQFRDFGQVVLFHKLFLEAPITYKWGPLRDESDEVKAEYKDTRIYNV